MVSTDFFINKLKTMPKTRAQKEEIVKNLVEKLQKSKSAVFANFGGLKVQDAEKLRKSAKKEQAEVLVAKKTLLKIALKKAGIEEVDVEKFENGVATLVSYNDEIVGPKLATNFSKENKALSLLAGLLMDRPAGHRLLTLEQVKALGALPGRLELLAKLVGSVKSPISGFVNVLSGNLRGLVNVFNAIKDSKPKT